jgi:hypothetical protein
MHSALPHVRPEPRRGLPHRQAGRKRASQAPYASSSAMPPAPGTETTGRIPPPGNASHSRGLSVAGSSATLPMTLLSPVPEAQSPGPSGAASDLAYFRTIMSAEPLGSLHLPRRHHWPLPSAGGPGVVCPYPGLARVVCPSPRWPAGMTTATVTSCPPERIPGGKCSRSWLPPGGPDQQPRRRRGSRPGRPGGSTGAEIPLIGGQRPTMMRPFRR